MFRKVNIAPNQKVTEADFNDFGNHPREALDAVVRDFGGFPAMRYTGLPVEQVGLSTVRVGQGRVYKADGSGYIFDHVGGETIDLLDHLPAVAKRVASIVAYGNAIDTDLQPRTFLIDPETRATEGREVATESRRQGYVGFLLGVENPTPNAPAIPTDYVAVAHVILTPAGVESITQLTANRVVSNYRLAQDVSVINARLNVVGPQIDTLRTDVSGLAAGLRTKANQRFVSGLALDVARVKDRVNLPDDYATYGADHFLDQSESDLSHGQFNCLVREGARFPSANSATVPLALENPIEPRVSVHDNMVLPRFTSVPRISVVGNDGEYPLTNTTVETVELRQMQSTRIVREFLGSQYWCSNTNWWSSGQYDPTTGIFRRNNGETFIISQGRLPPSSETDVSGNLARNSVYAHRYQENQVVDTHWTEVSSTENVSGSVTAQTMLNSQDGYLTAVNLFFTKRASAGDVRVLVTEVDDADNPMLNRVLGSAVVPVAQINVFPSRTRVPFAPIFIPRGKRVAFVAISSGAHFLAVLANNKFAQGAMHYMVDGAWVQSTTGQDIAFEVEFAQFESPVVTVQLAPLELAGGIDTVRLNLDASVPDGTDIDFRVRVAGEWRSLREGADDINVLSGHPSLVQLQAVFVGTTDVMPALGIGASRSEVFLHRPASIFTHISTPRLMPSPIDSVEVGLVLENWRSGHSATVTLLTGAGYTTEVAADAIVDQAHPHDAAVHHKTATFALAAPVDSFKIKIVGNAGGSSERFHVAERTDIEFAN